MNTTETKEVPVEVIRQPDTTRKFIQYDNRGHASFVAGSEMKADEFALLLIADNDSLAVGNERLINALRLAKQLPDVPRAIGGGEKAVRVVNVNAYNYVCDKVQRECATPSTWQNIVGMVPIAELVDEMDWKCSPYVVKDSLAFLRKMGWIDDNNKPTQALLREKGKPSNEVILALKDGKAKVNAFRPVVAKAKEKANIEAQKKGEAVPFPKKSSAPALTPLPSSLVSETPVRASNPLLGTDTVDKFALDLKIMIGRAEKLRPDSESRKAFSLACSESIDILHRFVHCEDKK